MPRTAGSSPPYCTRRSSDSSPGSNKNQALGPALLLGDLNTSPGSALFGRIRAAGFHEGRTPALGPTYSSEGLTSGRFTGSGWHLDHVLVRGLNAATSLILDEPRTLEVAGRHVRSTLSDHAGLLSIIEQA